ncbi:MAG: YggS family pyridoxal phosphate-dependent enzyme [Anaerolineae bacterium]|nr:YggS family pyridoxal phosphate-dependent enzyme [Anaerolineae bacterium]
MTALVENIKSVQERIAAAARRAGRDPGQVTLVAVTKTQPPALVRAAYDLGLRNFGENRVEEAAGKVGELPGDIVWHMIGHIQSRKVKQVVPLFQVIHSVDRPKIARRLDDEIDEGAGPLPVLIECNVSGEDSKYGFAADRWQTDRDQRQALWSAIEEVLALPHLRLEGLMTMAPIVGDPEEARPTFGRLRALRDALAADLAGHPWPHLSMGMTDDFEVAIEEGATLVRIGRALFAPDLPAWRAG